MGDASYGDTFCGGGELIRELYAELGAREVVETLRLDASETVTRKAMPSPGWRHSLQPCAADPARRANGPAARQLPRCRRLARIDGTFTTITRGALDDCAAYPAFASASGQPAEWQARVDLAACYRLVALHGWDDLIFTHISAKIPDTEHFLINPYGLMFHEIAASSLVKVDWSATR